jgi:heme oxygenase (biliverdin-IX-beta and delta-forming)
LGWALVSGSGQEAYQSTMSIKSPAPVWGRSGEPVSSGHLLQSLRAATRSSHEALESGLVLTSSSLSLDQYKATLARFFGFYAPWEHTLLRRLQEGSEPVPQTTAKTPFLKADLASLGVDLARIPLCCTTPKLQNFSAALGSLYVAEGAALGGQLIARHVERVLGFSSGIGYSFFVGAGPGTGARWKEFTSLLTAFESSICIGDATRAAADTFARFGAWLGEGRS